MNWGEFAEEAPELAAKGLSYSPGDRRSSTRSYSSPRLASRAS